MPINNSWEDSWEDDDDSWDDSWEWEYGEYYDDDPYFTPYDDDDYLPEDYSYPDYSDRD